MKQCPRCQAFFGEDVETCQSCGFVFSDHYKDLAVAEERIVTEFISGDQGGVEGGVKERYRFLQDITVQCQLYPLSEGRHALYISDKEQLGIELASLWDYLTDLLKNADSCMTCSQLFEADNSGCLLYEVSKAGHSSVSLERIEVEELDFDEFIGYVVGWRHDLRLASDLLDALKSIANEFSLGNREPTIREIDDMRRLYAEQGEDFVWQAASKLEPGERDALLSIKAVESDYRRLERMRDRYCKDVNCIEYIGRVDLPGRLYFALGVASIYDKIRKKHGLGCGDSLTYLAKGTFEEISDIEARENLQGLARIYKRHVIPSRIPDMYLTSTSLDIAIDIAENCNVKDYAALYDRFQKAKHYRTMQEGQSRLNSALENLTSLIAQMGEENRRGFEVVVANQKRLDALVNHIDLVITNAYGENGEAVDDVINALEEIGADVTSSVSVAASKVVDGQWKVADYERFNNTIPPVGY